MLTLVAAGEPYHWPLDMPRVITSSFGECRGGRFHAGIDLRTGGVGPEVRAAADGYVSRIRCSPWGYGKAVYLRLDDGNTAVYAHLAEFASSLRAYVRRAQHARESYTVDLMPERGEFRIARGELIGYAGRSGTRAPHLHWEVRDAESRPINPRLLGLSWPDETPPVIRKALVVPRNAQSTVNGDVVPVVLEVREVGSDEPNARRYTSAPVSARGEIGIAVDVIDPANQGANILGVHILRTTVNGTEVFRMQNDRLSYGTMNSGRVSWHPYYLAEGRFLLQWRWPGNRSDNFAVSNTDGWIDAAGAPLDVHIEAIDFFGNRASLPFRIEPDSTSPQAPASRGSDALGRVEIDCFGEWLLVTARFPDEEPETPVLRCVGLDFVPEPAFRRVDGQVFRAVIDPDMDDGQLIITVEHPRLPPYTETVEVFQRGRSRVVRSGDLVFRADARSPFGTLFVRVSETEAAPTSGLVSRGNAYAVWPAAAPVDAPLEISFPQPDTAGDLSKVHIYRQSGSEWSRLDTDRSGGRLVVRTSNLGVFAAMADLTPPSVTLTHPAADAPPAANRRPEIRARVSDNASGIADIRVTANGKWLLCEYDPFASGAVIWQQDEDLPLGENEITVRVTDAAGNLTEVSRTLEITGAHAIH